jgi:hypothetical protein
VSQLGINTSSLVVVAVTVAAAAIVVVVIIIIIIIIIIFVKNWFGSLPQILHPNGTRMRGWLRGKCCISVIII